MFVICSLNIFTTRLANTPMVRDKSLADLENLVVLAKTTFLGSRLATAHHLLSYSPIAVERPSVEQKALLECLV